MLFFSIRMLEKDDAIIDKSDKVNNFYYNNTL